MKNSEYWAQRMAALMDAEMHKADTYGTDVATAYRKAAKSLQADIERWYAKFADNNGISMAEARKMLQDDELEEFQWTVQEYIKHGKENGISADWEKQLVNASSRVHISRYEALKLQCWQHAYEASGNLDDGLHLLLQEVYTSTYYHTAYEVQKGAGHGSPFAKIDTAQVEKVLSKPWAADGSDFSERIWKNRAQLVQELDAGLTQGIIRGDPPDKLVKHLSDRFGVSESRAQTLVQTESAHFANQAQSDNFKELGVAKYEVVAALDKSTCYICGDMDGQQFPLSEEKPGVNAPLFHARCRCCKAPVVEDEVSGERAARGEDDKTYYVPEDITYNDWAEQQGIKRKNSVANAENDGIIKAVSGGRITNPYGKAATAHAERYYGLVRSMKTDISRIAKNTGFPEEDIQRIKNFIFLEKHDLGRAQPEYFAPDFAMAQSWQRLIDGKAKPHDLTLLRHETLENKLMDTGMSQSEAHIQASKKYNYTKESDDYYGALKKHNNK